MLSMLSEAVPAPTGCHLGGVGWGARTGLTRRDGRAPVPDRGRRQKGKKERTCSQRLSRAPFPPPPPFFARSLSLSLLNPSHPNPPVILVSSLSQTSTKPDYAAVRAAIAARLDADDYDDGSYGPVLVRLAWHCSGTFDKATGGGGSNGATMRFDPEAGHGANAGLGVARAFLEPIKKKFPWISYADLYTLSGAVAIEEMGGPVIPWAPGRSDAADGAACPPDGRLPDAAQGASHLRDIFYRMGFDDR